MEFAQAEVAALSAIAVEADEQVSVLSELELSLVGGGMGDVAFG